MKEFKLPQGTIFRFTKPDARKHPFYEGPWDQLCVVAFDKEFTKNIYYRRLNAKGYTGYVSDIPLDSIELVGFMQRAAMGAAEWSDSFEFPHGMKPGTVIQHGMKPGTVIQFNTTPEWMVDAKDCNYRMVVMFPVNDGLVTIRRMPVDYVFTSEWDPRQDDFKIVGHLTPDQLEATDQLDSTDTTVITDTTVGSEPDAVKPAQLPSGTRFLVHDEPIPGLRNRVWVMCADGKNDADCEDGGTIHPEPDWNIEIIQPVAEEPKEPAQQLALGTKFRFNKIPERWTYIESDSSTVFEVVEPPSGYVFGGVGRCISLIDSSSFWYSAVDGVLPSDDIVLIDGGPSTADLHARIHSLSNENGELRDEVQLSVGIRFRFRKKPSRWRNTMYHDSSTVFEVTESPTFVGTGQSIYRVNSDCERYDDHDGVLPSDDIEILDKSSEIDKVDGSMSVTDLHAQNVQLIEMNKALVEDAKQANERTARLKKQQKQEVERLTMKIQELEKENDQLKGSISEWMASYRTIEKLSEKKPNAALAFIKKIW